MRSLKLLATFAALNIASTANAQLAITTVFDGPLSGGVPKGVELQALSDIDDLSIYGVGSANNGGGSDGQEFTFPAVSVTAGTYIYLSSEATGFEAFFGFAPDYTSFAMSINGDDAIEVFENGVVIDLFGDIDTDGTGTDWEYMDGWASRNTPAVSTNFDSSEWSFSGRNALDNESSNALASSPIPIAGSSDGGDDEQPLPELIAISAIQGNPSTYGSNGFGDTDVSPMIGETVMIEAVVVGDFQDDDSDTSRELRGFYVQEETTDEDGDPSSSEGIFVFDGSTDVDVNVGDRVRVVGTVDQFFGETQLEDTTLIEVLETDQLASVTPASISLSANTATIVDANGRIVPDLEAYEGMLVVVTDTLTLSEQFQLDRFNEVRLVAGERPWQFTQQNTPDVALYAQHLESIGARSIVYDDGLNIQNANIGLLDGFGPTYTDSNARRMGDQVSGLTGVLDYKWAGSSSSSSTWRIRSHIDGSNIFTTTANGDSPNPRPNTPETVAGNLKLASFNVLNLFRTLDNRSNTTANGLSPRGADDLSAFGVDPETAEFDRQLTKLVNAILAIDADILGLVELENEFDEINDGSTAIELLINALNSTSGDNYDYVYPGSQFVGTDAIAVGVIYKTDSVALADGSVVSLLDDGVASTLDIFSGRDFGIDPIFNGVSTNRVSLAASFVHLATDDTFTIAVNHFKSKGSSGLSDTSSPNFDQNDGAGFWNQRRLDAAIALDAWLSTSPTGISDEDVVVMGDLNAYAQEEPVQYLLSQGFNNVESSEAYSFVFDGQIGTLDYLLISDALAAKLEGATVWGINADEADAIDYNLDFGRLNSYYSAETAARNSDHDPVIAGFTMVTELIMPIEILDVFLDRVEEGQINGTHPIFGFYDLLTFETKLRFADYHLNNGNPLVACRFLQAADRISDANADDIVAGPGVAEVNRLIAQSLQDLSCTE